MLYGNNQWYTDCNMGNLGCFDLKQEVTAGAGGAVSFTSYEPGAGPSFWKLLNEKNCLNFHEF